MFELAYSSIFCMDTDRESIIDILEVSRRFNVENDITGCLLCHNGVFTQLLEGNKEIVQELYSRILQDERHYDVKRLYEGEKDERIFRHWSMAFLELDSDQQRGFEKELFEENLYFFSHFTEQSTPAVKLFWGKVRQIIKK